MLTLVERYHFKLPIWSPLQLYKILGKILFSNSKHFLVSTANIPSVLFKFNRKCRAECTEIRKSFSLTWLWFDESSQVSNSSSVCIWIWLFSSLSPASESIQIISNLSECDKWLNASELPLILMSSLSAWVSTFS